MGNKSGTMTAPSVEEIRLHDEAKRNAALFRSWGCTLWETFRYPRHPQPVNVVEEAYKIRLRQQRDHTLPFPLPWTEQLKVLLCGVRSTGRPDVDGSPLSMLAGLEESVLKQIYEFVLGSWKASVQPARPARLIHLRTLAIDVAFSSCGPIIEFPAPTDRKVNMMPFMMGKRNSLPKDLQVYYDQVIAKCPVSDSEYGQVCYLTVHESWVEAGQTQRRGGLHVEAPGTQDGVAGLCPAAITHWGCGSGDDFVGGLFMASSVAGTTRVFDDLIDPKYGTVDKHGGVEHLRPYLGEGTVLNANELIWFTDRTPHEALPQPTAGYRQFFRLVTSKLSEWYEEHSTPNPKVPVPKNVTIVKGSKFCGRARVSTCGADSGRVSRSSLS